MKRRKKNLQRKISKYLPGLKAIPRASWHNLDREVKVFVLLLGIIFILLVLNAKDILPQRFESISGILYERANNIIYLRSMSLEQKIGQMLIVHVSEVYMPQLTGLNVGGIFLMAKETPEDFTYIINLFQNSSAVPLFVAADVEGCINPFENFRKFPALRDIESAEAAFSAGCEEGKLMKELGFDVNFSPVVDLEDSFWRCRSFIGTPEEISEKAKEYVRGLQSQGVIATVKHYPGKTISVRDPHKSLTRVVIETQDLIPFEGSIKEGVKAVMISHTIADGAVDSEGKPAVVSGKLVGGLRKEFFGLIITDDTRMKGLQEFYSSPEKMYIDLVNAGNDLILVLGSGPDEKTNVYLVRNAISTIADAVRAGKISESRVDNAVIRILRAKGLDVRY